MISEFDQQRILGFIDMIAQESFAYRDITGQDRWQTTWTPSPTNLTVVGTPTYQGRFRVQGRSCEFQIQYSASTSIASTAGTTYFDLPIAAKGLSGFASNQNQSTAQAANNCYIDTTNSRCYIPTIAATANVYVIFGKYEI